MKQLDHRRRLIDSFVNAIYLFDDYLVITFNYKEGTKTITFAEIEEAFGSDLSSLTAPKKFLGLVPRIFFTSSLLPLTYYFQKILDANFSEKWRVKSEEVKNPDRFRIQDFLTPPTHAPLLP